MESRKIYFIETAHHYAQLLDPQVGSDMKNSQEKLELNKGHYPINLEGRSKKGNHFKEKLSTMVLVVKYAKYKDISAVKV